MFSESPTRRNIVPLEQALRGASWIALAGGLVLLAFASRAVALGWASGALWNLVNIALLGRLAVLLNRPLRQARRRLIWLLIGKFGGLYPAGIWILWARAVSIGGFVSGFTAVLLAVALGVVLIRRRDSWAAAGEGELHA